MDNRTLLVVIFVVLLLVTIFIDMTFISTRGKSIGFKKSLVSTGLWVTSALFFGLFIFYYLGKDLGLQYITGYVVEESLSMDNLFVFLIIFSFFKVPETHRHRVLIWGIVGAIVLRGLFIVAGISLITKFHFVIYILAIFLIYTGIKLFFKKDEEVDLENNVVLKFLTKHLPLTKDYHGDHFFVKKEGKLFATPMLLVLAVIETTDLVFAVDSIPTILGISQDTIVVYTSNIFAVMGLRALFFALSDLIKYFYYLHHALAIILLFIGVKMLLEAWIAIPIEVALGFVFLVLSSAALLSYYKKRNV